MHDYSLWCPVVTICALLMTDGQMDGWTDECWKKMGDISAAELKAQAVLQMLEEVCRECRMVIMLPSL